MQQLGLPAGFGIILLTLGIIFSISPWIFGVDFGVFKIPKFPDTIRNRLKWLGPLFLTLAIVLHIPMFRVQGPSLPDKTRIVYIASKSFLESSILAEMMAIQLEKAIGDRVEIRVIHDYGKTSYLMSALREGEISIYAEYSGTLLAQHLKLPYEQVRDPAKHQPNVLNKLLGDNDKFVDLTVLPNFGFNNSYVVIMTRKRAKELGLAPKTATISQLAEISQTSPLTYHSTYEFFRRPVGLPGLVDNYSLRIADDDVCKHKKKYIHLRQGECDITDGYTTDPELTLSDEFFLFADDKNYFPKYLAMPIVRNDLITLFPKVEDSLSSLGGALTEKDITQLIDSVKKQHINVEEIQQSNATRKQLRKIVREFLIQKSL